MVPLIVCCSNLRVAIPQNPSTSERFTALPTFAASHPSLAFLAYVHPHNIDKKDTWAQSMQATYDLRGATTRACGVVCGSCCTRDQAG